MRRLSALAILGVASFSAIGCGYSSYEARLEATQRRIRDEMILDRSLYAALQAEFAANDVFLRFPQGMAQRPDFELIQLNPGFFEIDASFNPQGESLPGGPYNLHVLVRRDSDEPEPQDPQGDEPRIARGDFRSEVLAVLAEVYGPDVASAPTEQVNKAIWPRSDASPPMTYERVAVTDRNNQLIHIYFYQEESGNASYDVALIWEFPTGEAPSASGNPIDLTLGTFAVGQRARARFSGRPDSPTGAAGEDGGAAIAF